MLHSNRAGQQFRQLPMFMTAREITSQYQALDGDRRGNWETAGSIEDDDRLFDRKYREAETDKWWGSDGTRTNLKDNILDEGVKNPVSLQVNMQKTGSRGKPEILGGHHRVAVMNDHKPDTFMPVEHFKDSWDAGTSLRDRY
jgi:hypothetical protein